MLCCFFDREHGAVVVVLVEPEVYARVWQSPATRGVWRLRRAMESWARG